MRVQDAKIDDLVSRSLLWIKPIWTKGSSIESKRSMDNESENAICTSETILRSREKWTNCWQKVME